MPVYEVELLQDERKTLRCTVAATTDYWANIYGREIATQYGLRFIEANKLIRTPISDFLDQQYENSRTTEYTHGLEILFVLISHLHNSLWEGVADKARESHTKERLKNNKKTASKWWTR